MAIAFVQGNLNFTSSSVASLSTTYSSSQTAGHTNFAAVLTQTNVQPTVTDNASPPNSYSLAASGGNVGQGLNMWLFVATSISGGASVQVTATPTTSGYVGLAITEYSGVGSTQDGTAQSIGANGTAFQVSTGVTTTNANDLVISIAGLGGAATITAGTGYTMRESSTFTIAVCFEDQITSSTGTFLGQMTASTAINYGMVVAAFKAATSSIVATGTGSMLVTGTASPELAALPEGTGTMTLTGVAFPQFPGGGGGSTIIGSNISPVIQYWPYL